MDILSGLLGGASDVLTAVEDFFSALVDPHTYVRLFFIVLGAALVLSALAYGH